MERKHRWLQLLGKELRMSLVRENQKNKAELPTRWVELIHRLDKEEQKRAQSGRGRR